MSEEKYYASQVQEEQWKMRLLKERLLRNWNEIQTEADVDGLTLRSDNLSFVLAPTVKFCPAIQTQNSVQSLEVVYFFPELPDKLNWENIWETILYDEGMGRIIEWHFQADHPGNLWEKNSSLPMWRGLPLPT